MTRLAFFLLLLTAALGSSCRTGVTSPTAGPVVTEWRTVGTFDAVEVSRAMEVIIREGASDSIHLEVSEGYLPYIRTTVANDVLSVYVDDEVDLNNLDANDVTIWVPTLRGIAASGASIVRVQDTIETESLGLLGSGASVLSVLVASPSIDADLSGASVLDLAGRADRFRADLISGASTVRAYGLSAAVTYAGLSGASILETTTTDTLTVVASGASIVRYKGQPHITSRLTGGSLLQDGN